jgi:hypothetical protein
MEYSLIWFFSSLHFLFVSQCPWIDSNLQLILVTLRVVKGLRVNPKFLNNCNFEMTHLPKSNNNQTNQKPCHDPIEPRLHLHSIELDVPANHLIKLFLLEAPMHLSRISARFLGKSF